MSMARVCCGAQSGKDRSAPQVALGIQARSVEVDQSLRGVSLPTWVQTSLLHTCGSSSPKPAYQVAGEPPMPSRCSGADPMPDALPHVPSLAQRPFSWPNDSNGPIPLMWSSFGEAKPRSRGQRATFRKSRQ